MEELVIVHDHLDGKSVEKCQFSDVCVEGRIHFGDVAQVHLDRPVTVSENYVGRTCSTEGRNSKFVQEFGRNANDRLGDFVSATTLEKRDLILWFGVNWLRLGSNGGDVAVLV
jgi:hypothetical protein